jgi:DNA polymerase-4
MSRYKELSGQVFEIFHEITPLVEGLSLDEAFLDVTASQRLLGDAEAIAGEIRRRIRSRTGLTASVGIAPNKLLAKIASDLNKPDGMYRIGADNVQTTLDGLPIQKLFGIGQKTLPAVQAAGIHNFGDLRRASDQLLWRVFGKHARLMRDRASGLDDRPVEPNREEQSISAEETFEQDIREVSVLRTQLARLADRTASRLRAHGLAAGRVTVKIRRGDFTTFTRQHAIEPPTQDTAVVSSVAQSLFDDWSAARAGVAVRLLGVGVGDLQTPQADLFSQAPLKESRLDAAVDGIRGRFGSELLTRASLLGRTPGGDGPRNG